MTALAKVLLVDDERQFADVLTRRLAQRNFCVKLAHSGEDALTQLAADQDIEVVLLDAKMPGIDGIETLKRIKKKWPLVEVIMLTGHSTLGAAIDAIKIGACDYLQKPIEINRLISKIQPAASRKRHRDKLILEVYMTPYLTRREQKAQIARILDPETKRGGE